MGQVTARSGHPPRVVGPFILIGAGVIFLLNNLGILPWFVWWQLLRLWPVVIVLIGLRLVLRNSRSIWLSTLVPLILVAGTFGAATYLTVQDTGGGLAGEPGSGTYLDQPLGSVERANVDLSFGAGRLVLGSLYGDSNLLFEGTFDNPHGSQVVRNYRESGGTGYLTLRSEGLNLGLFSNTSPIRWDVKLAPQLPLNVSIKSGAADSLVDLTNLRVTDLTVDLGASRGEIRFPSGASMTRAKVSAGAADLILVIPREVAARVKVPNVPFGVGLDVDKARFAENGNLYTTGDWNRAENKVEIEVNAGLAKLTLR